MVKRGININLSIQKKDLWLLSAIIIFLIGVAYVVAYNPAGPANPAIMGHSANEIEGIGAGVSVLANNVPYTQTTTVPADTCNLIVIDANLKGRRMRGDDLYRLSMIMNLNGVDLTTQKLLFEGYRNGDSGFTYNYGGTTSRRIYIEETNIEQIISSKLVFNGYDNIEASYSVICY